MGTTWHDKWAQWVIHWRDLVNYNGSCGSVVFNLITVWLGGGSGMKFMITLGAQELSKERSAMLSAETFLIPLFTVCLCRHSWILSWRRLLRARTFSVLIDTLAPHRWSDVYASYSFEATLTCGSCCLMPDARNRSLRYLIIYLEARAPRLHYCTTVQLDVRYIDSLVVYTLGDPLALGLDRDR